MFFRRGWVISGVSLLLSGALVFAVYILQLRQIELQKTVSIVVPTSFVDAGVTLTESMLQYQPMVSGAVADDMVTDLQELVGLEAAVPLGKGEPVLRWKAQRYPLLPKAGESSFPIPKEYVLSVSGSLRAGDQVRVYVTGQGVESQRLYSREVTVASVKAINNIEVEDPKEPHLYARAEGDLEKLHAARREANGAVDRLVLNLTEEEWLALDSLCKTGKAKVVLAGVPISSPR
ncbi:SAF domain-containing protein [Paenibacillus turpanensis]|uniref:SAF domain-containing protein n=1 Tax=Paenibacillus turpanensis TaxID=2689078 RepID=UPI00140DA0F7|nr:SAF domain-containing protein [Paenibacillus turpanensis]